MKFPIIFFLALAAVPAFSVPLHARSDAPAPSAPMSVPNTTMSAQPTSSGIPSVTMSAQPTSSGIPSATMSVHPSTTTNSPMVNATAIALELNVALGQLVNAINALEGTNGTSANTTKVARRAVVAALSDNLDGSNDHHVGLRSQLWSTFADILRAE